MTDLALLEHAPTRPMTEVEEEIAASFYAAVQQATNTTARSIQSSAHRVGVSDLGFCSERVRRHIAGESEPEVDHLPAFIGTALGDHIEDAMTASHPGLIRQAEVSITLLGDGGSYTLNGHPDLIDPAGRLFDVKTSRGLGKVRRTGPTQQQQFQRHLYAKAAHALGMFDVPLSDVVVANVWFDRAADERECYVHAEPYDERVVDAATIWLDDIVYAYRHGEVARKEPPVAMCFKACGFASECRVGDFSSRGLITDPDQLAAVAMHLEGIELERQARQLKDQAKQALADVQGSTGHYSVRWIKVGSSHVEYDRQAYERLDVRRIQ